MAAFWPVEKFSVRRSMDGLVVKLACGPTPKGKPMSLAAFSDEGAGASLRFTHLGGALR